MEYRPINRQDRTALRAFAERIDQGDRSFFDRLLLHDVAIEPLVLSAHGPLPDREFLMHYGRLRPDEIRLGVERLARAVADRPRRAIA